MKTYMLLLLVSTILSFSYWNNTDEASLTENA
jgi:hypothetical protein